ncbi:MAG: hypothetical protein ACI3XA_08825 [Clostridia bacterium]
MSKIICNKCGEKIKINSVFLETVGCENCGNRIDFSTLDALSGVRQALMLGVSIFLGIVGLVFMIANDISFSQLPAVFADLSAGAAGMLLIFLCIVVLLVGQLEKMIGCRVYEDWRKREEELEKIAEKKRAEDAAREAEEK